MRNPSWLKRGTSPSRLWEYEKLQRERAEEQAPGDVDLRPQVWELLGDLAADDEAAKQQLDKLRHKYADAQAKQKEDTQELERKPNAEAAQVIMGNMEDADGSGKGCIDGKRALDVKNEQESGMREYTAILEHIQATVGVELTLEQQQQLATRCKVKRHKVSA